jgi:hemerythrin-like domain-containing protein
LFYLAKTIDQTGDEDELRQNLTVLTAQCAQLNEANRAWQQFQQAQLENFRNKLQDHLSLDENVSFDQAAQLIIDKISKERKDFNERYQTLETENDQLRSGKVFLVIEFIVNSLF